MIRRLIPAFWLLLTYAFISGQSGSGELSLNHPVNPDSLLSGRNELTIYVIPSKVPYDWSSPCSLYKSYFKNYFSNIFKKEKYVLGHAFMELRTPLAPERIFTGMRNVTRKEQKELVFKQHYGLSILGTDTEGKLETDSDLEHKLDVYSRKGQLAFMSFSISDAATERMIRFFREYKAGIDSTGSPGARYGGAFWPRYRGEGAGCSAFVITFLDLAGILKDEFDEWMVKINIPMDLIGGPYNDFNEVKVSDIKKHKSWAGSVATDTVPYEHFELYDPSLMYEWIQEMWDNEISVEDMTVTPVQLNKAKGIVIDGRNLPVPDEDYIFMEREEPSIFIDYYHQKCLTAP